MNKMKLTKENIYINLQGKSKEELTELYWLLKNNNEDILNDNIDYFIECYLDTNIIKNKFHYCCESWSCATLQSPENKQEVTIQQLKEILQPMENKEYLLITEDGYEVKEKENVSWVINDKYKYELTLCEKHKKLIEESEGVYKVFKSKEKALEYHNKMLLSKNSNLPLTEQLEKAKAEVKRLKEAIEEESKPKEITIDISKFDIEHLIKMRNYFGENDKTTFEHASYGVINRIIKQINKQIKRIN